MKILRLCTAGIVVVTLTGCAAVATGEITSSTNMTTTPSRFRTLIEGRYQPAKQAEMVDCVDDAMTSGVETILNLHVRQAKRADGYRVDIVFGSSQYLVANVRDSGRFQVLKSDYNGAVRFDRQEAALRQCLAEYGATEK